MLNIPAGINDKLNESENSNNKSENHISEFKLMPMPRTRESGETPRIMVE